MDEMKKTRQKAKRVPAEDDAPRKIYFTQIDILKAFAIISVVLIHIYNNNSLLLIGAPFYLMQAVPVFLLLAAFNNGYALSVARKITLAQCYDLSIIRRRVKRLAGPYLIVWIFQVLLVFWFLSAGIDIALQDPNHFFYNGMNWIFNLLSGASGPGHYFIPLIVQLVFVIPFFYWLALRSPDLMLVFAFILDLVCEYIAVAAGMPQWLYGIIIVRYIFMGALGVWLVFQKRVMTRWILAGALLSACYIFAVSYLSFQFWIFSLDPAFYHASAYFWTLFLVVLGFQYLPSDTSNRFVRILAELGKASWHIFLVQMTVFFFFGQPLNIDSSIGSIIYLAAYYLVPCLSIGYGFYRLQDYIFRPEKNPVC
jgi:peptidoglycan/LPS O-acetylase OafA/YrhL